MKPLEGRERGKVGEIVSNSRVETLFTLAAPDLYTGL